MGHSFLDQGLQFTGLVHLGDDIATAHQLAANVELRKCRPVRVSRKGSADIGIAQDVDIREAFAAGHETLHRLRRKSALRRLRRAFHIEQDRVALDLRLDRDDGFLAHPSLEYVDCIRALYMLQVLNIVLKRGDKHVFDDASITVHAGHSVGVVGRNGTGKTTLFELILRRLTPEEGDVVYPRSWRVATLDQHIAPSSRCALDFVIDGDRPLRQVEAKIERAERDGDLQALANLHASFEDMGGYDAHARAGAILHGLGFRGDDVHKTHREFSGGWRIRLNLARTLMAPSDLLLLDEPTNHLDLDASLWLETWLGRYPGTSLTISHDRDFLDAVCEEIVHVADGQAALYSGNYSAYERRRAEALSRQSALYERQRAEIARIHQFANRFRAKATKARQVQSRLKALDRMARVAPVLAESPYRFVFPNPDKVPNPILSVDDASIGYDGDPILDDVTLRVYSRDRIGILGANGAGKTTLLKVLAGQMDMLEGDLERAGSAGYFAQHQMETLNARKSALANLLDTPGGALSEQAARDYLGGWGFVGDMAMRPSAMLSGGERARLVLALIARSRPAVLLLDEPTNHLDLDMREALAVALQAYDGALLLVSHDRHLLRQCVDDLWLVANGTVTRFESDIDAYAEMRKRPEAKRQQGQKRALRRRRAAKREALRPLRDRRAAVERDIERCGEELDELTTVLGAGATYELASPERISEMLARRGKLRKRLAKAESAWLEVQERIEEAEAE